MKQYVKSVDYIRVLAILAVVLIHTTTRTLEASKFNLMGFPLTIFLNQIARFAVPIFFLISGFVLEISSTDNLSYLSFLKKRLSRIFIPYVFWSAIYYLLIYTQNHENFLLVLLKGDASYQLYFIPTLFIFYLIFPLLHRIYNFISNKWLFVFLFISQIFLLYRDYFVEEFRFAGPIHIAILAYFVFIAGMVAARHIDAIKRFVNKWKFVLIPAVIVSGIFIFAEGLTRFLKTGNFLSYYSQWRPSTLIYTILLGLVLFYLFEIKTFQFKYVEKLSRLSFLVFLIHVIVLELSWTVYGKSLFALMGGSVIGKILFDPVFFGTTVGLSFAIAFIIHKIPYLKKLIA